MFGPKSLKKVRFMQIVREIRSVNNISKVLLMSGLSSFIRYLFFTASVYSVENMIKADLIKE